MDRTPLLGMNPAQLKEAAVQAGLPSFTGNQLARWLYVRRAETLEEMTDISKAGREKLSQTYCVGRIKPIGSQISRDGTRKYLFPVLSSRPNEASLLSSRPNEASLLSSRPSEASLLSSRPNEASLLSSRPSEARGEISSSVEAVMIPEADRKTLCVSSQAGCKMNCKFCMTGRQGFHGNLTAAEILSQFLSVDEAGDLTNAVFMGMGEPLDNWEEVKKAIDVLCAPWGFGWSPKRITLSTIGVVPMLKRFLDESRCHLAVSLHNPFHEQRLEMMPAEKAWPLESVIDLIKQYDFTGQRRVSFEYTVFNGWNDTPRHAQALIGMLRHLECRVNLIRFHSIPDFPYKAAPATKMEDFRNKLERGGLTATIRASRGEDIMAACGLLAGSLCHTEAPQEPSVSQTPQQR